MVPRLMSATTLARAINVPVNRITDILGGKRRITARTALLFADYFQNSPEFWLRLQMDADLREARRDRFNHSHTRRMAIARPVTRPPGHAARRGRGRPGGPDTA
jgi:addiction module HigA family antidote